jgi:hypothetical protein
MCDQGAAKGAESTFQRDDLAFAASYPPNALFHLVRRLAG